MPTSKSSGSFRRGRKGFTLFEIVVVMGVVAVLSALMLGYSQRNSKQVLLATTQAKIASIFSRAKFLSIQTFFYLGPRDDIVCGHGVYVDTEAEAVFVFQDIIDAGLCSGDPGDYEFDGNDRALEGELNGIQLAETGIDIAGDSGYVIFIPPEPIVKFDGGGGEFPVEITDGEMRLRVTVSEDGQIKMD